MSMATRALNGVVTLVTVEGCELLLPVKQPPSRDFTYAGRLWSYNQMLSEQMNRPIFNQITVEAINVMREQAASVLLMADRFTAQLQSLSIPESAEQRI